MFRRLRKSDSDASAPVSVESEAADELRRVAEALRTSAPEPAGQEDASSEGEAVAVRRVRKVPPTKVAVVTSAGAKPRATGKATKGSGARTPRT